MERLSGLFNSMVNTMVESGLKSRTCSRILSLSSGVSLFGISPFHCRDPRNTAGEGSVVVGGCSEGEG